MITGSGVLHLRRVVLALQPSWRARHGRYARGMVSAERFAARQSKEFCIWTITSAQIMATAASSTVAGNANARFSVQRATRSVGRRFFVRRRRR